jgi:hypothetical protein
MPSPSVPGTLNVSSLTGAEIVQINPRAVRSSQTTAQEIANLAPFPALPAYTIATLPTPGTAGRLVRCTNFGAGGAVLMDTGTRWKPSNNSVWLGTLDTPVTGITNAAETIAFQYLIPAALLRATDRLRLAYTFGKSGTTDNGTIRFRMGTAGTTADTQLYTSGTGIVAANRATSSMIDFRIETATTIQQMNQSGGNAAVGYSGSNSGAVLSPITISNVSNALYFSLSLQSAGAADTLSLLDAQLQFIASPNV